MPPFYFPVSHFGTWLTFPVSKVECSTVTVLRESRDYHDEHIVISFTSFRKLSLKTMTIKECFSVSACIAQKTKFFVEFYQKTGKLTYSSNRFSQLYCRAEGLPTPEVGMGENGKLNWNQIKGCRQIRDMIPAQRQGYGRSPAETTARYLPTLPESGKNSILLLRYI